MAQTRAFVIGQREPWIFGSSNGTMGEMEEKPLISGCNETETHQVNLSLILKEEDIKEEECGHMISCPVKDEKEEKPFAERHCKIETDDTDSNDETLQTPAEIEVEIEEDEQHDYHLKSVSEHPHVTQRKIHGHNLQLQGRLHHCTVCRKSFTVLRELEKHQQTHTTGVAQEQNTNKNCDLYGKRFTLISTLKTQIRSGEKPHQCILCEKAFVTFTQLKRHMRKHIEEKSHKCLQCGKAFITSTDLRRHMLIHTGEKPHKCVQCGKAFSQMSSLKSHVLKHTGEKPHKCVQCGKAFSRMYTLKSHMLAHTTSTKKPHKSAQCGKTVTLSAELKRHILIHTGKKPHKCVQCGKAFSLISSLNGHVQVHCRKKAYKCIECGKVFSKSKYLKSHMVIHTGEKPHKCAQCEKAFRTYQDLKRHILTHTGEKPHKCVQCR
ncbi:uncharacterized protein LOC143136095 [Alosa pseudoharengus]|uniref:uncharacterized protein LOC143136095 n=1 Tax=Alosa pseudoharengus TaxID=34774 RepID=UPI003F8BE853